MPTLKACTKMFTTGTTTRKPTTIRTSKVRPHRTHAGSCCAVRTLPCATGRGPSRATSVLMAHAPVLQAIDQDEEGEGRDEQDDGDRRRLAVRELLEARDDQD